MAAGGGELHAILERRGGERLAGHDVVREDLIDSLRVVFDERLEVAGPHLFRQALEGPVDGQEDRADTVGVGPLRGQRPGLAVVGVGGQGRELGQALDGGLDRGKGGGLGEACRFVSRG